MNEARTAFKNIVKGDNVITPHIRDYKYAGDLIVELSEGTGFEDEPIFGVTVVDPHEGEQVHDLSQLFWSLKEAHAHIAKLSK